MSKKPIGPSKTPHREAEEGAQMSYTRSRRQSGSGVPESPPRLSAFQPFNHDLRRTPGARLMEENDCFHDDERELSAHQTGSDSALYNYFSAGNISPSLFRYSILPSPVRFATDRYTPSLDPSRFETGLDAFMSPKRSTSPLDVPSPVNKRQDSISDYTKQTMRRIHSDSVTRENEALHIEDNQFLFDIMRPFVSPGEYQESPRWPPEIVSQADCERDFVLSALRSSIINAKVRSSEESLQPSIENEQTEPTERPMSVRTKAACKEFIREFRKLERVSVNDARNYAKVAMEYMPKSGHWRIHLELADLAKRLNEEEEAAFQYGEACRLEPTSGKGWLEWSKMQDDSGNTEMALQTVLKGIMAKHETHSNRSLPYDRPNGSRYDEVLILRALRLYEKQNRLRDARRLMFSVISEQTNIQKVWRVIFEGAQMEFRAGWSNRARMLYSFLMDNVAWYGPIYLEALRLEEAEGNINNCLKIISKGLQELHRYGPLWFGLLRVMEKLDIEAERLQWATRGGVPKLVNVRQYATHAIANISRELVWKIHFEIGQIEERAVDLACQGQHWFADQIMINNKYLAFDSAPGSSQIADPLTTAQIRHALLASARKEYMLSLVKCPANLKWKVLVAGARLELSAGQMNSCRELLAEAMALAPLKSRTYVLLECSRVEEYLLNYKISRVILQKGRIEMSGDWKIFLESALLEARARHFVSAVETLVSAVECHTNAGRLWALLIQILAEAWSQDREACEILLWSLFEKSSYAQKYYKLLQSSGDPVENIDSMISSIDSLGLTDTEKSTDSAIQKIINRRNRKKESAFNSMSQLRRIRLLLMKLAVDEVPKSGEVWCEAARCVMNPLSFLNEFDLALAFRYLSYAVLFTPQYGDSFIERIRFEIICQIFVPRILASLRINPKCFFRQVFMCDVPDSDRDMKASFNMKLFNINMWCEDKHPSSADSSIDRNRRSATIEAIHDMSTNKGLSVEMLNKVQLSRLERSCTCGDPNYGSMWYYCRMQATENTSEILGDAYNTMLHEICDTQEIYSRAVCHFIYKSIKKLSKSGRMQEGCSCCKPLQNFQCNFFCLQDQQAVIDFIEEYETTIFRFYEKEQLDSTTCPLLSVEDSFDATFAPMCPVLNEVPSVAATASGLYSSRDFSSALISFNRSKYNCDCLPGDEKKKYIFCSDQVMP